MNAVDATQGKSYRRTRVSSVEQFRGFSVLIPVAPREQVKVLTRIRARDPDSRDTWILSMLRDGAILFWRYIRKENHVARELAALPADCRLRQVKSPAWLPKSRKGGDQ